MRIKKILAITMAATMVIGSSMTAFAADANGATGTGTNTGHLDTDVFTAVLPTDTAIANFFDFTIDPENILASADKFTDGTTAAGADFKNADLVYFKQAEGAAKAYASTSQAADVGAKNYIDVDVKVDATIGAAADGKTIIPMVSTSEELTAATTPSLLLQLKVGDQTAAITADGGTATKTIAGQPDNYEPKWDGSSSSYKLAEKSSITWSNNTAAVQLTGKVKGGTVDTTVVAPSVTLTWTVSKHNDGPIATPGSMSTSAKSAVISGLGSGVTLKSAVAHPTSGAAVTLGADKHYTYNASTNTFTVIKDAILDSTAYTKFVLTYSDDSTVEIPIIAGN